MDMKNIKSALEEIALDVGGDLECVHTLLQLFESHCEAYRELNLPSDLTSDFVSLVVRFLVDIETNIKQLEDLAERMTA